MNALIISLPSQAAQAGATYEYVLSHDGRTVTAHASAPAALLPAPGRSAEVVAVVPAQRLSWHEVELPQGIGPGAPRLRSILYGLLEEHLLDEPEQLHFALAPGVSAGGRALVAVCESAWLKGHLQALEAAQRTVSRLVPELAPGAVPARAMAIDHEQPCLLLSGGAAGLGVLTLPLTTAAVALLAGEASEPAPQVSAEPGVAALAERLLQHPVPLQPRGERLLQAMQSSWDLAQFDLASSGRARTARQLAALAREAWQAPVWRPARWGVGALLAAQLLGLNAWAWKEQSSWQARRTAIDQTLIQTFPQVRVVVDAPLQMTREVDTLRQVTGAASGRDLEAMLSVAASGTPPGWSAEAVEYSPGELRLKARALTSPEIERLSGQLRPLGYAVRQDGAQLLIQAESTP